MTLRSSRRVFFAVLAAVSMTACGSSGSSAPATASTSTSTSKSGQIDQPTVINLYPNQSASSAPLLTVMVTAVGNVPVKMPLGFDTGSAGVTLYAQTIFPASMVNSSGFIFSAGQTSLTYNGITVTNVQGTRSYGTVNQTIEYGNLGFTQITFGDAQGTLTTEVMPVFLFYSITDTQGRGFSPPAWQGWFGVASTNGTIDVPAAVEPPGGFDACSQQTATSCYVVSAMKYVDYGTGLNAGFKLSPATIQTCDIATTGNCTPAPMLTVGLNADAESGFSTTPLTCPPNGYVGPADIAGYAVCQKTIPNTTFTTSGAATGTFVDGVVFDCGTGYVYLSTPTASSFPAAVSPGSTVTVMTPSGFNYSYTAADSGSATTVVSPGGNGNSIVGIQYFTTNSFLIDLTSNIDGWK